MVFVYELSFIYLFSIVELLLLPVGPSQGVIAAWHRKLVPVCRKVPYTALQDTL